MAESAPRYDGHADWYDENFAVFDEDCDMLRTLIGDGSGAMCLEVACGTGRYAPTIAEAGFLPVGVDLSSDQLRKARERLADLVRCDVRALPFPSGFVETVVGMYFHTDVVELDQVADEIARVLRPGGRLVYVGVHPAFIGPFVNRSNEAVDGKLTFVPGYGSSGWSSVGSGGGSGLWSRVGGHHKTLEALLGAFLRAGLQLVQLRELGGGGVVLPRNVALVLVKPTTSE